LFELIRTLLLKLLQSLGADCRRRH
jgi:hypothetical protein